MKIISFAWTSPALIAGRKTVTRRRWTDVFARGFRAGAQAGAWDKLPRNHGKKVAIIQLIHAPYRERYADMPDEDYEAEGFAFFEEHPELLPTEAPWLRMNRLVFDRMRELGGDEPIWVVRFKLLEVLS